MKALTFPVLVLVIAAITNTGSAEESKSTKAKEMNQEPKIIQMSEMKYVGLAITHRPFEKGSVAIPNLWKKFIGREAEIKDKVGPTLGIAGDFNEQDRSASYIASAQVKNFDKIPEGMVSGVIPAGTYAEFKHKGPISTFGTTAAYIHGTWLPKSGYKNKGAMVEVYPKDCDVDAANFEMTVLLPVSR